MSRKKKFVLDPSTARVIAIIRNALDAVESGRAKMLAGSCDIEPRYTKLSVTKLSDPFPGPDAMRVKATIHVDGPL